MAFMQVLRVPVPLPAALWPAPVDATEHALDFRFWRSGELKGWAIFESLKPELARSRPARNAAPGRPRRARGASYFMVSDPFPLKSRHHYPLGRRLKINRCDATGIDRTKTCACRWRRLTTAGVRDYTQQT